MDKKMLTIFVVVLFVGTVFFSGCSEIVSKAKSEFNSHTECVDGKCEDVDGWGIGDCVDDSDCKVNEEDNG